MQNFWKARQTQYTGYVTVYILVIVAILAAANFLAKRYNKSYDSTENKRFSLADQTTKLVRELKTDAKVLYFDRGSDFARARDLLDRYGLLSPKLKVEYIDVDKKPLEAKSYGVRRTGTIIIEANNKREEARSLTEEEVTSALIRALKPGDRVVCSVTGQGEHSFDDTEPNGYSMIKTLLERSNYKTRAVPLNQKAEVPKDCTILLIGGPRYNYAQPIVDAIRNYRKSGGRLLVALGPPLAMGKEVTDPNDALVNLVGEWGITMNKDLIFDMNDTARQFGLSEFVPLVADYDSHVIVRDLKGVATVFPLTRSIEVKSPSPANMATEKLFSTSSGSFATTKLDKLNRSEDKKGPFVVAAVATGGEGDASKARTVVVGSDLFMSNQIIGFSGGNRDLSVNMFNWLSADEDLISIRPKDPQDRRLNLTRAQMRMIQWTTVILLPLAVVGLGMFVWWRRR